MTVTTSQLARESGLTDRHIRRLCTDGVIRAERIGRDWLIPDDEAERFLRGRQRKSKRR